MAMIPVSHISETSTAISFPWVIRCQVCGAEVARVSQEELSAMVAVERVEPVLCFGCEALKTPADTEHDVHGLPQNKRAPWPMLSVPRSLLGFI
jgi:hypothetical protein